MNIFRAGLVTLILLTAGLAATPSASADHCGAQPLTAEVVCQTFEWYAWSVAIGFNLAWWSVGIAVCVVADEPLLQAANCI